MGLGEIGTPCEAALNFVFWIWFSKLVFEFATRAPSGRRSCPPPVHLRRYKYDDSVGDDARAFVGREIGRETSISYVSLIECSLRVTPILEWLSFVCLPDMERAPDHATLSRTSKERPMPRRGRFLGS